MKQKALVFEKLVTITLLVGFQNGSFFFTFSTSISDFRSTLYLVNESLL